MVSFALIRNLGVAACMAAMLPSPAALAQGNVAAAAIPEAPRELRGVWISSVYNGNWPSRPGLPVAQQQKELIAMMDAAQKANLNAIVFQVRPG